MITPMPAPQGSPEKPAVTFQEHFEAEQSEFVALTRLLTDEVGSSVPV
jgi:hypothetical protein